MRGAQLFRQSEQPRLAGSSVKRGKALVVGQVALSFALIVAAGLLLGTFRNVLRVDPGFAVDGVLLVRVDLQGTELEGEGRAIAKQSILARLRALPNVR